MIERFCFRVWIQGDTFGRSKMNNHTRQPGRFFNWLRLSLMLAFGLIYTRPIHAQDFFQPPEPFLSPESVQASDLFHPGVESGFATESFLTGEPKGIADQAPTIQGPTIHGPIIPWEVAPVQVDSGQLVLTKLKCGETREVFVSQRDQIWLISARNVDCNSLDLSQLGVCHLKNGRWQESTLEQLAEEHSTDTNRQTMVFVHGNRWDLKWCSSRGLQFYEDSFQQGFDRPPIRLVMFCWKSEQETFRPLQDYKIKTQRSLSLAPTFSQFLNRLKQRKVLICSYSLGAQIVVKALEQPCMCRCGYGSYHFAMLAPAFDPDYSCQDLNAFGHNPLVSCTEVFVNREDRVIRASEFVARKRCRKSVSTLEKLAATASGNQIRINDITDEVKASHALSNYTDSPTLQCKLSAMLTELSVTNSELVLPEFGQSIVQLPAVEPLGLEPVESTPQVTKPETSVLTSPSR